MIVDRAYVSLILGMKQRLDALAEDSNEWEPPHNWAELSQLTDRERTINPDSPEPI